MATQAVLVHPLFRHYITTPAAIHVVATGLHIKDIQGAVGMIVAARKEVIVVARVSENPAVKCISHADVDVTDG